MESSVEKVYDECAVERADIRIQNQQEQQVEYFHYLNLRSLQNKSRCNGSHDNDSHYRRGEDDQASKQDYIPASTDCRKDKCREKHY